MKRILTIAMAVSMLFSNVVMAKDENLTPSGILLDDLEAEVDNYMNGYIGELAMGSAVIIIENGEIVLSKGYGYADYENKVPINPDSTVFEYASISKAFTWTAVMQMVDEGCMDLDRDIRDYLPEEFVHKLNRKLKYKDDPITMLDLMNHTAGFEDRYFNGDFEDESKLSDSLMDALINSMPIQVYKPGEVVAYSNFGAGLAGYVVECVTGEKLYNYLDDHIFAPCNMDGITANPRYDEIEKIVDNKAKAYELEDGLVETNWTYVNTYPDGSLNGTANDLAKYVIEMMSDDNDLFKNDSTIDEFFTASFSPYDELAGCAHGLWEYDGKYRYYSHDGSHDGFTTIVSFSPKEKCGVIVFTNTGDEIYTAYGLTEMILGDSEYKTDVPEKELPDARDLDGMEFVSARRNYSDLTSVYGYMDGNEVVNSIDEHTIQYKGLTYVQVKPYYYELEEKHESNIANMIYSKIYFIHDGENVTGLTFGGLGIDYQLKSEKSYTNFWLLVQLMLVVLISISFLVMPFLYVFRKIYSRIKKKQLTDTRRSYNNFIDSFNFTGFLMVINQLSLAYYLLNSNSYVVLNINIHIIINIILVLTALAILIIRGVNAKKLDDRFFRYRSHFMLVLRYIILVLIMFNWNFFKIIF